MTSWTPHRTYDGSYTFFSEEFGEAFHNYRNGAKGEAFQKFAVATRLATRAQQPTIKLLDVCYGLGYNTAAAIEVIWQVNPQCHIELYALELDATVPIGAVTPELLQCWSPPVQEILSAIATDHVYQLPYLDAHLLIGDARQTIQTLKNLEFQADAIFFDPFSPRSCPQLWTVEFFQAVAACLAPTGTLSTYSRAAAVRSAMISAGLTIGTVSLEKTQFSHEWSQGTIAAWNDDHLEPLSQMEQEHLQTRAAIPYRDRTSTDSATEILQRHAQEQAASTVESSSDWRRRWKIT